MNNQDNNKELNPLEKQLKEINECQKNANNPGYFVGSGKVPIPSKNLLNSPIVSLIIGSTFLIPTICDLVSDFSIQTILGNVIEIIIGLGFIIGGIIRLLKKIK
ncbi:hypothetical protein SH2C18_34870 [Clostridium sediminicola]|uniref:hypothetical protein n=1 Tax=Clostridium sediminicola TaxID=3114879 RepID=UPI0031F24FEA